jgi:hypothetical protein
MSAVEDHAPGEAVTAKSSHSRRWAPAVAFAATLLLTAAVALIQAEKPFYYDSGNYWLLGQMFVKHGSFSLLNFGTPFWGYLLPLIDHALRGTAELFSWRASTSVKLFNALLFAGIGAVLAPRLAEMCWPQRRWGIVRRLSLVAVLIIFWSGYLNFPLSDFPALAMVLLAFVTLARPLSPSWMLVGGAAAAAAIDIRPAYELVAPAMLVLAMWLWLAEGTRDRSSIIHRAVCLAALLLGFIVVSLPQSLSDHRYFHTWNFVPGAPGHLEGLTLTKGLGIQRYETFVGAGHNPQLLANDQAGLDLLAHLPGGIVTGPRQYLELIAEHPLVMGGVLGRHLINGLDQRYSTPYIEHLDTGSHRLLRIGGFLLVFLALLRVLWPAARRRLGLARWRYPVALLICAAASLPASMETRYLLPVYLLSAVLTLVPGWPSPIAAHRAGVRRYQTLGAILVGYLLFMALVWQVTSSTSSHLHFV